MASKSRKAPRRGKRPIPWLWVIAALVLVAAAFALARHHGRPFGGALGPGKTSRAALPEATPQPASSDADEPFLPIEVKSDWDRIRLRTESEFLRIAKRATGPRSTASRAGRSAAPSRRSGIDARADRRASRRRAAAGAGHAPVQWRIQVPPRASLFRINDAVTQAIDALGGHVISGRERPAPRRGTALDLRVGYGDRVTHAIVVEPNPRPDRRRHARSPSSSPTSSARPDLCSRPSWRAPSPSPSRSGHDQPGRGRASRAR